MTDHRPDSGAAIHITAPVWLWHAGKASWHFLTITADPSIEIRLMSIGLRGGFGSIKVAATIGDTRWRTSLFPHSESGGYLLPIKADVRKREGVSAGDVVNVTIEVIGA